MSERQVESLVRASAMAEGQGVTVHRTVGTAALSVVDPFLLLDEFVIAGDAKGAGFPDHPHRGFETVTYMLSGRMAHADTAGNAGMIGPGAAQWMTAGRGLVHSEMPESDGEVIRGLQLWVNLAAADKMIPPRYQDVEASDIPTLDLPEGGSLRVIAGSYQGVSGPIEGIALQPLYLDLTLNPAETMTLTLPSDHTAMLYVLSGTVILAGQEIEQRHLAITGTGDNLSLKGSGEGGRAVLIAARRLDEPVARYGPFVMNSRAEIEQAIHDFRAGRI